MKKSLGSFPGVYPMPVLMVAAYDENGKVNVMNAAWGMICAMDKIALFIDEEHKTTQNLLKTKAFTVSIADRDAVNAPVIEEFPYVMECELAEVIDTDSMYAIVGKIVDTKAEESILDEKDRVEIEKLNALIFDQFKHGYYVTGEQAGKAWNAGKDLMKKKRKAEGSNDNRRIF